MRPEEEGARPDAGRRAEEGEQPRRGEDALTSSGAYEGCFRYGGWEKAHRLAAALRFDRDRVEGSGSDERGNFLVKGSWNAATRQVEMRQTWSNGLVVVMRGVIVGGRIEGDWQVPEEQRGYWRAVWRRLWAMHQAIHPPEDAWVWAGCADPSGIVLLVAWLLATLVLLLPIAIIEVFRFFRASFEGGFELSRTL